MELEERWGEDKEGGLICYGLCEIGYDNDLVNLALMHFDFDE